MQSNITWIAAGFVLGALAAWILLALAVKKSRNPEETKLTAVWGLDELARDTPVRIMAERVSDMRLPRGAKVLLPRGVVGALPPQVLADCEVRMHDEVRGNFAIGEARALLFTSHVHPRAWVVWTRENLMVQRLASEFSRMWKAAEPFVERVALDSVGARMGSRVEVRGRILEKYDYHGKTLLRLTDGRQSLGLVTENGELARHVGSDVVAVGKVVKEAGHAVLALEGLRSASRATTPMAVGAPA